MNKEANKALGQRLAEARRRVEMTQAQAAASMGLHQPQITWIEAGERNVTALEVVAFARLYGVAVMDLLGMQDEPMRPQAAPVPLAVA